MSQAQHAALNAHLAFTLHDAVMTINEALTEGRKADLDVIRALQQLVRLAHMADLRLNTCALLSLPALQGDNQS